MKKTGIFLAGGSLTLPFSSGFSVMGGGGRKLRVDAFVFRRNQPSREGLLVKVALLCPDDGLVSFLACSFSDACDGWKFQYRNSELCRNHEHHRKQINKDLKPTWNNSMSRATSLVLMSPNEAAPGPSPDALLVTRRSTFNRSC